MTVYILLPILIALMIPAKKNKIAFGIVFISMLLVSALRSETVGTDTSNYLYTFMENRNFEHFASEPIWLLLMKTANNEAYMIISSILLLIPLSLAVRKYDKPFLLLLFYVLLCFYSDSFNITRQEVAVCYILLGLSYWEKKKWIQFYICISIATCIHNTAILAALFPLINSKLKLSSLFVYISLPISYIIGVMLLSGVLSFMAPALGQYEEVVLDNEYVKTSAFSINRILLNVVFVLVYTCYNKEYRDNKYLKLFYLAVILYNLLAFSGVANRIVLYFSIAQIIVFTNFQFVKKDRKSLFVFITLFYALAYYTLTLSNNRGGILPYEVARCYENMTNIYYVITYALLALGLVFIIEHLSNRKKKDKKLYLC